MAYDCVKIIVIRDGSASCSPSRREERSEVVHFVVDDEVEDHRVRPEFGYLGRHAT
ncbi:hypothetical protein MLP_00270 [Microlunatus phosphovorus NM-1]|uniref:Uncharacterized protein n=1 Tax=Microlunatus phosphovorus (strain ATCC 700054 / DSM 10555 / JCM 9379 / NBRC 101784 / NCIMB 13414 / VKM Ac-1990 / NM-1) TaxID=1032480 RepID=F5XGD4_MICPN|nr:hypothetical protein MLP_00270 [Microlunatus phosphovorus NM-1]